MTFSSKPKNFDEYYTSQQNGGISVRHNFNQKFNLLDNYIQEKKQEMDEYRRLWNSDDNDNELQSYYDKVIESEPQLYTDTTEQIKVRNA